MPHPSSRPQHHVRLVLALFLAGTVPAWATNDSNDPVPQISRRAGESEASYQARYRAAERARASKTSADTNGFSVMRRRGESEASYQARVRAAGRANTIPSLLEQQPEESSEAYLKRLQLTVKGLLSLQAPEVNVIKRNGESEASYQARCRAAQRADYQSCQHLVARPNEDSIAYQQRLRAWKRRYDRIAATIEQRRGGKEATYRYLHTPVQQPAKTSDPNQIPK